MTMHRGEGVHTVPASGRGWKNEVEGTVVGKYRLKERAVRAGRALARRLRVEHTIHRTDGVITEKNSYGNDPYPPKDSS
jgi:hypothetical protein